MQKDMKRKNDRLVALLGAVLCVCACLVGCGRKEEPAPSASPAPEAKPAVTSVVSRADDAAYQAQVKKFIADAPRPLVKRDKIRARMDRLRERARKALPAGATEEQVTAELENNPRKYPAWRELVAALKAIPDEVERNRAAAQSAIRQRISRESADRRAQGAATAEKK